MKKVDTDKKYNIFQNILFLTKEVYKFKKSMVFYMFIVIVAISLTPFVHLIFPKMIIDELLSLKNSFNLYAYIITYAFLICLLGFISIYIRNICEVNLRRFKDSFTLLHVKKCMAVPYVYTEDSKFLDLAWKTRRTIEARLFRFMKSMPDFIAGFTSIAGYTLLIMLLDYRILILLILNVIIIFVLTNMTKKFELKKVDESSRYSRRAQYSYDVMYDFAYGKDIRLFHIKDYLSSMFKKYRRLQHNIQDDINKRYLLIEIVNTLLILIRDGLVLFYLVNLAINKDILVGSVYLYFNTIIGFSNTMEQLLSEISAKNFDNELITEVRNFLEFNEQPLIEGKQFNSKVIDSIRFDNVSFKYPNSNNYVLRNFDLTINTNESVAIVGLNGCGKTTLVKLLCKLYPVESGRILINDVNINDLNFDELTQMISPIFQDFSVFAFSIKENITLSTEESDADYINRIIEDVNLTKKINSLEENINTSISKDLDPRGIDLSGGEKQSLALARCLYKNTGIVVLDEPTAAFDAITEDKIYTMFQNLVKNKIAIYISHRMASTKFCNNIAYIENGKVAEYGTHDELIQLSGRYADLFQLQARYYLEPKIESM